MRPAVSSKHPPRTRQTRATSPFVPEVAVGTGSAGRPLGNAGGVECMEPRNTVHPLVLTVPEFLTSNAELLRLDRLTRNKDHAVLDLCSVHDIVSGGIGGQLVKIV